jgi:uncharacterized protein involved in exopolysaccharide biosynthesis
VAAGIGGVSQLQEVGALVKRRVWQVLLPAVLTGSLGVMAGSLMPNKYTAKTTMELVAAPQSLAAAGLDMKTLQDEVRAADFKLKTQETMSELLGKLDWDDFQTLPPDERRIFIKRVVKNLKVDTHSPTATSLLFINFEYTDTEPQRAAQFANELRDYFVRNLIGEVRKKAVILLEALQGHHRRALEQYDESSRSLEEVRKENNISPTQDISGQGAGTNREQDPVYAELQSELSKQVDVNKALREAEQARKMLALKLESVPEEIDESEESSGLDLTATVAKLRAEIVVETTKQSGLTPLHPTYKRAAIAIRALERQIEQALGRSTEPTREVRRVPNPERKELNDQIADVDQEIASNNTRLEFLEKHIAELVIENKQRTHIYAELARLSQVQKVAEASLFAATMALDSQRQLVDTLGQPEFSPFEVTEKAVPPTRPSSPSALIVVAAGILLGLALGVLWALLAEFGRNAYRGPADLARALPAPVLGAINQIVTLPERRARSFRSGLAGASTLILAGGILWVTWAYRSRPHLLGPELTGLLDDVRGKLR